MDLTRISRKYVHVTLDAKLANGTPATLAGVDIALLPVHEYPTSTTTWTPSAYADGQAVVLLAGPDADPVGALVVPANGADLWARITDSPEVDAARIERIVVT